MLQSPRDGKLGTKTGRDETVRNHSGCFPLGSSCEVQSETYKVVAAYGANVLKISMPSEM